MAKTNLTKRKTRSNKFPLTLHPTGQYCKKIKGKLYYFGSNKQQALQCYLEQASYLHLGKASNSSVVYDDISLKALCNLYLDPSVVDSLPDVVKGLSSGLQSLAGLPTGELLQDPTTEIATNKKIKQYAKDSGTSTGSEDKNDVFLVVYYAAIASAMVFNHKKITQHSYKKDWVIEEIKGLFHGAQRLCRRMAKVVDSAGQ